jgi:hypothetical protein
MPCLPTNFHVVTIQRKRKYLVVSLDPNKFAEKKQQRFQIGDIKAFIPYTTIHNQSCPVIAPILAYHTFMSESGKQRYLPFPPHTKVFLYYFTSPKKPPIAGELRFRVTSSDDPASFESGSDLLKPNGHPWSRPLFVVSRFYTPLYEKLREERLVPDDLDAVLSTLPQRLPSYGRGQYLYTLNDTFIVNFGAYTHNITAVTEQDMEVLILTGPFHEMRGGSRFTPYTGAYTNHDLSILLD